MYPFASPMMMGQAAKLGSRWNEADKQLPWTISADGLTVAHDTSSTLANIRATPVKSTNASFTLVRQGGSSAALAGVIRAGSVLGNSSSGVIIRFSDGQIFAEGDPAGSATGVIENGATVAFDVAADGLSVSISVNGALRGRPSLVAGSYLPSLFGGAETVVLANFAPTGKPAWS